MNDLFVVVDSEIRNQKIKNNKKYEFIWVILRKFWSFPSFHSMLKTSALSPLQSRSLAVSYSSYWNFNTSDSDDLLENSKINILLIIIILLLINLIMEYKIYSRTFFPSIKPFQVSSNFVQSCFPNFLGIPTRVY